MNAPKDKINSHWRLKKCTLNWGDRYTKCLLHMFSCAYRYILALAIYIYIWTHNHVYRLHKYTYIYIYAYTHIYILIQVQSFPCFWSHVSLLLINYKSIKIFISKIWLKNNTFSSITWEGKVIIIISTCHTSNLLF